MPKDCANIYGHSYMPMVAHTFWPPFRPHFDYNLHFIDCLLTFNMPLSRTILFVKVFGFDVRNIREVAVNQA